jgi:hypothetical protein
MGAIKIHVPEQTVSRIVVSCSADMDRILSVETLLSSSTSKLCLNQNLCDYRGNVIMRQEKLGNSKICLVKMTCIINEFKLYPIAVSRP